MRKLTSLVKAPMSERMYIVMQLVMYFGNVLHLILLKFTQRKINVRVLANQLEDKLRNELLLTLTL